jgi:hypothetical protein
LRLLQLIGLRNACSGSARCGNFVQGKTVFIYNDFAPGGSYGWFGSWRVTLAGIYPESPA